MRKPRSERTKKNYSYFYYMLTIFVEKFVSLLHIQLISCVWHLMFRIFGCSYLFFCCEQNNLVSKPYDLKHFTITKMDKETKRVPEEIENENNGSLRIVYCTVYTEPSIWCAMHFFCSLLCLVSFKNHRRSVFSTATTPAFVNISEIFVKQHQNTR